MWPKDGGVENLLDPSNFELHSLVRKTPLSTKSASEEQTEVTLTLPALLRSA